MYVKCGPLHDGGVPEECHSFFMALPEVLHRMYLFDDGSFVLVVRDSVAGGVLLYPQLLHWGQSALGDWSILCMWGYSALYGVLCSIGENGVYPGATVSSSAAGVVGIFKMKICLRLVFQETAFIKKAWRDLTSEYACIKGDSLRFRHVQGNITPCYIDTVSVGEPDVYVPQYSCSAWLCSTLFLSAGIWV